jgi:FkbM family methyltransferase
MSTLGKLTRNLRSVLTNPRLAVAYARWTAGKMHGEVVAPLPYGAEIGGFENFSNYWGTLCKISCVQQIDYLASYMQDENAVCFDVGANIGSFSLILGKRLPKCLIHAFEPAPNTFGILSANIARNRLSKVEVHQLAVAEEDGIVHFSNEPSISQRNHIVTTEDSVMRSCEVPATSLDTFCESRQIERVGFIKVDCEGVEPLVLRGAKHLLREKRIGAMLIEVCPRNLDVFGFTIQDLLASVADVPYAFHRFEENGAAGEMLTKQEMMGVASEDFLLLPI